MRVAARVAELGRSALFYVAHDAWPASQKRYRK
jgi:hypothetical protein